MGHVKQARICLDTVDCHIGRTGNDCGKRFEKRKTVQSLLTSTSSSFTNSMSPNENENTHKHIKGNWKENSTKLTYSHCLMYKRSCTGESRQATVKRLLHASVFGCCICSGVFVCVYVWLQPAAAQSFQEQNTHSAHVHTINTISSLKLPP